MATLKKGVVLLDFWVSPFGQRCRIALAEKGVKYEYKEENLAEKSQLLLKLNPVHKKIPVFVHDGKPICESLVIVQYIDQVWTNKPLLPFSPYERATALFWADFVDKKVYENGERLWKLKGEAHEEAKKDMIESLKLLEGELGDKKYFGGETFGFVDVALVPFTAWFYTYETYGNFSIEEECPKLVEWGEGCRMRESVVNSVDDPPKVCEFVRKRSETTQAVAQLVGRYFSPARVRSVITWVTQVISQFTVRPALLWMDETSGGSFRSYPAVPPGVWIGVTLMWGGHAQT